MKSGINTLVLELCPNGAEKKPLTELAYYEKNRIPAQNVNENTYVGVENLLPNKMGKTVAASTPKEGSVIQFFKDDILIGNIRPYLRKVWLAMYDGGTNGDVLAIHIVDTEQVLPKYLYYVLSSEDFFLYDIQNSKGAKMPRGNKDAVMQYFVSVPPLPIQREIVRVLDNFTELTARKKQYEYYRDTLLTFGVHREGTFETKWRTLGEVCGLQAGKAIPAIEISPVQTKEYSVPCYGGNGLRGYVKTANQQGDKPLVGRQGALCGNVCYATGSYYATEHAVVVSDKGFFNSRFLYHALVHANLNQYKTAGAQPGLSVAKLEKVKIPVPEKEIQDRIAKVLDNFDAICSDLNIGLPAEIEARKKQYEYYRDMLLTFAAADDIILTDRQTEHN